nr:terpene synthase TPS15 [Freesia refracta]
MACLPFHYTSYSRSSAQLFGSSVPSSHYRPRRSRSNQSANRIQCCNNTQISSASQPLRRTANYPPTIWENSYIQELNTDYMQEDEETIEIGKLKEYVMTRLIISRNSEELLDQIELIDTLQQLGVAYHFQEEIQNILATIFCSIIKKTSPTIHNDIYATALLFRLLRENGFHVSTSIFNNFKEEEGTFKACLKNDIKGMLSLYEASFLAVEGENELDEARLFATQSLRQNLMESSSSSSSSSKPSLEEERIAHALELPLHWRIPRLHTRWFIDWYEKDANMNPTLLRLAKLDFNFVQSIYKRELKELSRWWTNLDLLGDKLGFARDRLVENYLWTVGSAFEPKFWQSREALTKASCLITTIDDIYDVYGTLDELETFTEVVDRWDVNAIEQLPDYMKTYFLALFNTTYDIAYKILNLKGVIIIPQLKKVWADLCKAYLVEAKWYHSGYMPTLEEYLDNGWISISGHVALAHAFCTSEDITYRALQCYNQLSPNLAFHSSVIVRLVDDLATSTEELERGDVPKAIQCYMKQNGVSEEVARENIREMIVSTWKKLNGDLIATSSAVESFQSVALNLPRMAQCIYQYGDGYGEPRHKTKDQIISLLIEPFFL